MDEPTDAAQTPRILIVDDAPQNLDVLVNGLKGYDISVALSGEEALDLAREIEPDLILMDVMMPGMDGFEACSRIKRIDSCRDAPVIFLTGLADSEHKLRGFEAGGVDYVSKPIYLEEVRARVKAHLTIRLQQKDLRRKNEELERKNNLILEQARELERLARTDPLTGLLNRRAFLEKAREERARSKRNGMSFAVALADIDFFKSFNDRHGHDCGDFVLVRAAETLRASLRERDVAARWGGEEFIFLLPETDLNGAQTAAEKIRRALEGSSFRFEDKDLGVTLTIGAALHDGRDSIEACIARADEALYKGKEAGRNRVVVEE